MLRTPTFHVHPLNLNVTHSLKVSHSVQVRGKWILDYCLFRESFVHRDHTIPFLVADDTKTCSLKHTSNITQRYLQELKYTSDGWNFGSTSSQLNEWFYVHVILYLACKKNNYFDHLICAHLSVLRHLKTLITFSLQLTWCSIIPISDRQIFWFSWCYWYFET